MAGFSQQLQGSAATAAPITEGIGEDMNLKGVAAGLGLASTLIGSSYAESTMDASFKDVVADYKQATAQLKPATDKLNILSDQYQKTQDPKLLRQMTELDDQIRRIKLGEDNGKLSGLSAKAKIESAYKTAIHRFPKFASELRAHKDQATGTGLVGEAVRGNELMLKQATSYTKKLYQDMIDDGWHPNSPQERVQYMALRRVRNDRDARLDDVEAGYKAILSPLDYMNNIKDARGKPEEDAKQDYKDALEILTKEMNFEKLQVDMSDYKFKHLLDLKTKLLSYKRSGIGYDLEKATYDNKVTTSNNTTESSGEAVESAKRQNRIGNSTEQASKDNPYLKGDSMRVGTERTEQTVDFNNKTMQDRVETSHMNVAELKRTREEAEFTRTNGVDFNIQARGRLQKVARSWLKPHQNMTPTQKALQFQQNVNAELANMEKTWNGRKVPASMKEDLIRFGKTLSDVIRENDPVKLDNYQKEENALELGLGTELYRSTIGDTNFKGLALSIIKLQADLAGTNDPAEKREKFNKLQKLNDEYQVLSTPLAQIMERVKADKTFDIPEGMTDPQVAFVYAMRVSQFDPNSASPEESKQAFKNLKKALDNKNVAADVLDTSGAIAVGKTAEGRPLYEKSYENILLDTATAIGALGKIQYYEAGEGFVLSSSDGKTSPLFVKLSDLDSVPTRRGQRTRFNQRTLDAIGVRDRGTVFRNLINLHDIIRSDGNSIIKGFHNKDFKSENYDVKNVPSFADKVGDINTGKIPVIGKIPGLRNPTITGKLWETGWTGNTGKAVAKNWEKWKDRLLPVIEKTVGDDPVITSELMVRLIGAETSFVDKFINGEETSKVGAVGAGQFMPATIKYLGGTVEDAKDYKKAIPYIYKYLKKLEKTFGGDLYKMIAAYNSGEGRVRRYGGVPAIKETENYVTKIVGEKWSKTKKMNRKSLGTKRRNYRKSLGTKSRN